ncbi:MAG: UDP-N-acetylmuramoyl-tripeptide--D-alanyl-D-alanine ligase, partial [Nitrospirae bacterium]|nr:UDP-N-acetylmuramoyl-tripeptide--D-alanyl-D-alanine ligase [Nitrospirota bacterium]
LEILDGLQRDTSPPIAVLNADDDFLMQGAKDFKGEIITFSIIKDSNVKAEDVAITDRGSKFTLVFKDNVRADVALNIHGIFNVYNALAASAVCFSLGITIDEIKKALEDYSGFPMRFEVLKRNNITLINDSYNANPSSMAEALKGFACFKEKGRLVAALGDMNELGRFSEESHRAVGRMVSEMGIDVFIAVGEKMSLAAEEIQSRKNGSHPVIYKFSDSADARQKVSDIIRQGDTVLVKGSRSMGMEKIIARIKEAAG